MIYIPLVLRDKKGASSLIYFAIALFGFIVAYIVIGWVMMYAIKTIENSLNETSKNIFGSYWIASQEYLKARDNILAIYFMLPYVGIFLIIVKVLIEVAQKTRTKWYPQ